MWVRRGSKDYPGFFLLDYSFTFFFFFYILFPNISVMAKLIPSPLLFFIPNILVASSFTVSDGVQSLIRIFGNLLLGFINSGEYLIILGAVFILFIFLAGAFVFFFALSLTILRKLRG